MALVPRLFVFRKVMDFCRGNKKAPMNTSTRLVHRTVSLLKVLVVVSLSSLDSTLAGTLHWTVVCHFNPICLIVPHLFNLCLSTHSMYTKMVLAVFASDFSTKIGYLLIVHLISPTRVTCPAHRLLLFTLTVGEECTMWSVVLSVHHHSACWSLLDLRTGKVRKSGCQKFGQPDSPDSQTLSI
jgi:hypothetical protein